MSDFVGSVGGLEVRSDRLGSGKFARATFFYQNRSGQRVSNSK
jgi:hypothetical protein